jgi:hypothetical protein
MDTNTRKQILNKLQLFGAQIVDSPDDSDIQYIGVVLNYDQLRTINDIAGNLGNGSYMSIPTRMYGISTLSFPNCSK